MLPETPVIPTRTTAAPTAVRIPMPIVVPLPPQSPTQEELERARGLMLQSFDLFTGPNTIAIHEAGDMGLQQSIIPLIELTRVVFEDHIIDELGRVLQELTGASFGGTSGTSGLAITRSWSHFLAT